uniref:Uncharacterized protein n=1 Tax=Rhizophora mucronata TaxID=61149 RepID=A0A2P2J0J5_RHIMU
MPQKNKKREKENPHHNAANNDTTTFICCPHIEIIPHKHGHFDHCLTILWIMGN